jgi:hypothetical protein
MRRTNHFALTLGLFSLTFLPARFSYAEAPPPIRLLEGTTLPVPPQQNAPWQAPARLPQAVASLFDLGLADPRGCEYREVDLVFGDPWFGNGIPETVHAWLLPDAYKGRRFAVAWNGLVYPVRRVGEPVSLPRDAAAMIHEGFELRAFQKVFTSLESASADYSRPSALKALLLWRLGENELAQKCWDANALIQPSYLEVVREWTGALFQRAVGAHMRGDDRLALVDAEMLTRIAPLIEAECARQKPPSPSTFMGQPRPYLEFLSPVPALLQDTRRRLNRPETAVPARGSLEAQIADLENVDARQHSEPGDVSLNEDPRVLALAKRGDAAVEPLLRVMETDDRLTRSVSFSRDFFPERHLVTVSEAARAAISEITHVYFPSYDEKADRMRTNPEMVAIVRAYWEKNKNVPMAERWYRTLRDDKAPIPAWLEAANNIVLPEERRQRPGTLARGSNRPTPGKVVLLGEPLRSHTTPSVSELLARRSDQAASTHAELNTNAFYFSLSVQMALDLAAWNPASARPVLRRRLDRLVRAGRNPKDPLYTLEPNVRYPWEIGCVAAKLAELGDKKAWPTYADWMRHLTHQENAANMSQLVSAISASHQNPSMLSALNWMLNDPAGPWYNVASSDRALEFYEAGQTTLGETRAFLRKTLDNLDNRRTIGKVTLQKPAQYSPVYLSLQIRQAVYNILWPEDAKHLPARETSSAVRVCDYYAYLASSRTGAPPYQLYWPQAKRDAALKQYAVWLRAKLGAQSLK